MYTLCDGSLIKKFEYIYFFIMVLYMAQMTSFTVRMVAGLSSPWIPFLLPIVLTAILVKRNPINFNNRKFIILLWICLIWEVAVTISKGLFSTGDQSFQFFLFYSIIVAFIHNRVYGNRILPLYETIIVLLCKLSLPLWLISILLPSVMSMVTSIFPDTNLGHNFLFIYNYIDFSSEHYLRNSGCSWEPGRFAIMIVLGVYCNIVRNGIRLRGNKNIIWLLFTLLTTMSTTGYSIVIVMYVISILRNVKLSAKIGYLILFTPAIYYLFTLDFMGEKLSKQLNVRETVENRMDNLSYYDYQYANNEYAGSLGRFEAMYFESLNVLHDPLLGYGRNPKHSFFSKEISSNFSLTGGIVKLIGMYGILLGLFFYFLLLKSSTYFHSTNLNVSRWLLFLALLLSSISYEVFTIPVFTSFWLFGYFECRLSDK